MYTFRADFEYRVGIENMSFFVAWLGNSKNDSVKYSRKELAAVTLQTAMHYFVIVTHFR
jgi:hypothetical protein